MYSYTVYLNIYHTFILIIHTCPRKAGNSATERGLIVPPAPLDSTGRVSKSATNSEGANCLLKKKILT